MSTPAPISDKLKALGVQVGTQHLTPARPLPVAAVESIAPGRLLLTPAGETYAAEAFFDERYQVGNRSWFPSAPLHTIAAWAGEPAIAACQPSSFAFLDIETTGLGGASAYAFMVGIGRLAGGQFHIMQFFLRHPGEEAAHLLAIEDFLAPCNTLVTFNGKSFDAPMLAGRYRLQGWKPPFEDFYHIDLLHLSRRLWRDRLPSRTLGNIETHILGAHRSVEDIPGWMVPERYIEYLHTGDASPLAGVFYHNAMDVLSLAALLDHTAGFLAQPLAAGDAQDSELLAAARIFEKIGSQEEAIQLYRAALGRPLEHALWQSALRQLAALHKRRGEWEDAIGLWQIAARRGAFYACVELAKAYEHERRDPSSALAWSEQALALVETPAVPRAERAQQRTELEHRKNRLLGKLA